MLVVVEHRDVQRGPQRLLDLEAFRRLDVLQVDAAEGRRDRLDRLDHDRGVVAVQLDVEDVHVGELLEEHRLALHHRLARQRAAVAQPQDGGAVGDHRHQVALGRVLVGQVGVAGDLQHGDGDARRVGQRQVVLGRHRLGGHDGQLAGLAAQVMVFQRVVRGDFAHGVTS